MDPLAALSVAGTIIQFVDFGNELLKNSVHLYKSSRGSLEAHEELELITADLQCVISKLRGSFSLRPTGPTPPLAGDQVLQNNIMEICDKAANIAAELLKKLNSLRAKDGKHRTWESLKAALKLVWSHDEILLSRKRLSHLKDALHVRITQLLGWAFILLENLAFRANMEKTKD